MNQLPLAKRVQIINMLVEGSSLRSTYLCSMSTGTLQKELAVYEANLNKWLEASQQGKFVLIKGDEIGGLFDTYEEALKVGYTKHGPPPFLVKQISAVESVMFITRRVIPHAATDASGGNYIPVGTGSKRTLPRTLIRVFRSRPLHFVHPRNRGSRDRLR